jgi:hypothetical protein
MVFGPFFFGAQMPGFGVSSGRKQALGSAMAEKAAP